MVDPTSHGGHHGGVYNCLWNCLRRYLPERLLRVELHVPTSVDENHHTIIFLESFLARMDWRQRYFYGLYQVHGVASWSSSSNDTGSDCLCLMDHSNFVECINVVSSKKI